MYLEFFGLKREPFHITPNPYFFYLSPSHKEAFASLIYGLKKRKGFIAVIGEVGLGKTTVLRTFLQHKTLKGRIKTIFVFNADISFNGLLRLIYGELGYSLPPTLPEDNQPGGSAPCADNIFLLVQNLHEILIKEYQQGNTLVLVIDEAQNMPVKTLESLRMLSNLETNQDKLLQIFLIGQPELKATLDLPELRQLKQRIALWVTLSPLNHKESIDYIRFRLKKAGLQGNIPFTHHALQKIATYCEGTPRRINILCDNALITAFGAGQHRIGSRLIKEVIADLESTSLQSKKNKAKMLSLPLLTFILIWLILLTAQPTFHPLIPKVRPVLHPIQQDMNQEIGEGVPNEQKDGQKLDDQEPLPPQKRAELQEDPQDHFPEAADSTPDPGEPTNKTQEAEQNIMQNNATCSTQLSPRTKSSPAPPSLPRTDSSPGTSPSHKKVTVGTEQTKLTSERPLQAGMAPKLPPLDQEGQHIHSQLTSLIGLYRGLSTVRQYVLIEMAKQTSINGLLTFTRMFNALEKRDYNQAARQMLYSHWARRVKGQALKLARAMYTGSIRDFLLAKQHIQIQEAKQTSTTEKTP